MTGIWGLTIFGVEPINPRGLDELARRRAALLRQSAAPAAPATRDESQPASPAAIDTTPDSLDEA